MKRTHAPRWSARLLPLIVILAIAMTLGAGATAAVALTPGTTVTTRNNIGDPATTFGGKPTRFTLQGSTGPSETVSSVELRFPKGTDLSKARFEVVTLAGLTRTPVKATGTTRGERMALYFSPSVEPSSNITIRVFDVVPPERGGTYDLVGVQQTASGVTSQFTAPFVLSTLTPTWKVVAWLDEQPWVQTWNSYSFSGLFLNPQIMVRALPLAFVGWLLSLALVAVAFPAAIPVGLVLAFMKMSRIAPIRWIAAAYINVIRGTPLFLQIYIAFFALPLAGVRVPEFPLGAIVLALNSSAYLAEIFRAGIQSINKGQFEAASSLGMTYTQAMAFVIIPQTIRRVLPTMTSEFILLFKDTALLAAVGVFELMKMSQGLSANTGTVAPYMVAAAYYLIITIPLINYVGKLEARLAVSEGGSGAIESPKKRSAIEGLTRTEDPQAAGAVNPGRTDRS